MNTYKIFPYTIRVMVMLTGLVLASFSCTAQQSNQVPTTYPILLSTNTATFTVMPTNTTTATPTNSPMPTHTPTQTSTSTPVPTPTVPVGWGQPGFIWSIEDAEYYEQLRLSVNDSDSLVEISRVGGGLMRINCAGCEFNVGTFLWAVYLPKDTEVYIDFAIILRYPTVEAAQIAIRERVDRYLGGGYVQAEIPESISLPPETVVLAVRNVSLVIARYGVFEIFISQGGSDTELPLEDSIQLTYHLAEIQIAKLIKAGY